MVTGPRGLVVKELRLMYSPSRLRAPATADLTSLPLGAGPPTGIVGTVTAQVSELSKKKKINSGLLELDASGEKIVLMDARF